jgi:hypothetical protein
MSTFTRKVRKNIAKEDSREQQRILAVADWLDTYGHRYQQFIDVAEDPVQSLLDLMKSHNISVVVAADLSLEFAIEYLARRKPKLEMKGSAVVLKGGDNEQQGESRAKETDEA